MIKELACHFGCVVKCFDRDPNNTAIDVVDYLHCYVLKQHCRIVMGDGTDFLLDKSGYYFRAVVYVVCFGVWSLVEGK